MSKNYKLSGEFQPNVFLDFLDGKAYSNRWAEGLQEFNPQSGEVGTPPKGLYIYAKDDSGIYNRTDFICPRCVMCMDSTSSNNIKVDTRKITAFYDDVIFDEDSDEVIAELNGSGPRFYFREDGLLEDMILTRVTYRPAIICMPKVRNINRRVLGVDYITEPVKISDSEHYTIVVKPSKKVSNHLELSVDSSNYEYIQSALVRGFVLLCADWRILSPKSYYVEDDGNAYLSEYGYAPDDNVDYEKEEHVDKYSSKFKINGEFVDAIILSVGSIVRLQSVVDNIIIDGVETEVTYWTIENSDVFQKVDTYITLLMSSEFNGNSDYEQVQDRFGELYASKQIYDIYEKTGERLELEITIDDTLNKEFEDCVVVEDFYGAYNNEDRYN